MLPAVEKQQLARLLPADLLAAFNAPALADLEAALVPVQIAAGATLFRQGDSGDSLYLLVEGRMSIFVQTPNGAEQLVDEAVAPTVIGELALLTGQPRSASVRALTDCLMAQLSTAAYTRLAEQHPAAVQQLMRHSITRLQRTQLVEALNHLFGPLQPALLHNIEQMLHWRHVSSGTVLFKQGDPGDAVSIVVSGRLTMAVLEASGERVLGEVGQGETVGEWALLSGEPRSATVRAIRDTTLAQLGAEDFAALVAGHPQLMMRLTRSLVQRQQRIMQRRSPAPPTTFALVPLGPRVPIEQVARTFATALAPDGSAIYLDQAACDAGVGKAGIAALDETHPLSMALVRWLNAQEAQGRPMVYVAEPRWSPWTMRCIRQADRIVLIANASDDPTPGALEAALRDCCAPTPIELVLLHPPTTAQPRGTARWLAPRSIHAHHHVRLHEFGDMARVARRVTGRAIGLVLGGGGARGFAHIGVLRALEEAGIAIDCVGGTSVGAVMAACCASGMRPAAMIDAGRRFGSPRELFDYTLPLVSFLTSKKWTRMLQTFFENVQIEDLWQPFFCISSDLTRAQPVVHTRGPVWKALRASTAIPGVFAPLIDNGALLVDGGVLNNLPVEPMRELIGGGQVIAVNVSVAVDMLHDYAFDAGVSGWQVLWRKLNPWAQSLPVPSIFATLVRSSELTSYAQHEAKRALADVFISPAVDQFSWLNFRPVEALAEAGYRAAREALAQWVHAPNRHARV